MASASSLPFFSLSSDLQRLIYSKMNNIDVIRMKCTSSEASSFVDANVKMLYSRPHYGDSFWLEACNGKLLCDNGAYKKLKIRSNFLDVIAPFSIKTLNLIVTDYSLVPQLVEILEKWKPICIQAQFLDPAIMDGNSLLDLIKNIRSRTHFEVSINTRRYSQQTVNDVLQELEKAPNSGQFHICEFGSWDDNSIFERMKNFQYFCLPTEIDYMHKFFAELVGFSQPMKLNKFRFITRGILKHRRNAPISGIHNINLPIANFGILSKGKLLMANDMCAIVTSDITQFSTDYIEDTTGYIMKNDDDVILDFLIENYLKGEKILPADQRKLYLNSMSTQQHAQAPSNLHRRVNRANESDPEKRSRLE